MYLLDVNVLIALCDSTHSFFPETLDWFQDNAAEGWATCPITENGMLRILGHPNYPGGGASNPGRASVVLNGMIGSVPGHRFFADDISLLTQVPSLASAKSSQLTDIYLLALAVKHGAQFLTLDQKIDPSLVPGGSQAYEVLR